MTELFAAKGVLSVGKGMVSRPEQLGFTPRALVLWWSCQERDGVSPGSRGGIGFAAVGSESGALAWVSDDGSTSARTASVAATSAIIGLTEAGRDRPCLRAEIELDEGELSLRVLAAEAAWRVHYLALGGAEMRAAVRWLPAPPEPGQRRLEIGFRPAVAIVASAAVEEPERVAPGLSVTLGAASGPGAQGSAGYTTPDGGSPGAVAGVQRTDAVLAAAAGPAEIGAVEIVQLARVKSFDRDGLTLEWSGIGGAGERESGWWHRRQALCLAMAGAGWRVGTGHSPPRPGRKRNRRIGVDPRALLCFSWGLAASPDPKGIARLSLGGGCAPGQSGATSWDDCNKPSEVTATHVHTSESEILLVSDSETGGLHATAALAGLDRGNFTLDWTRSDESRRQFVYVAFGVPIHPMTFGISLFSRIRTIVTRLSRWVRGQRQRSASSVGS